METKIRTGRLLKLAKHLESRKFGLDSFNFGHYYKKNSCGTSGCAIGDCPTLWPKHWKLFHVDFSENDYIPKLKTINATVQDGVVEKSGREWFGLTKAQYSYLFIPGDVNYLCSTTSKEKIVKHIRDFVKTVKNGTNKIP